MMIGNLERRTNIGEIPKDKCLQEFHRNAQRAREDFFQYPEYIRCSLKIEDTCRALGPSRQTPSKTETISGIEHRKRGLIMNDINVYKLTTLQAERRVAKLRKELDSPTLRGKVFKFVKIPGMALKANAELIQAPATVCRENCLNQRKCLSYSVNDQLEQCWLSATRLMYADEYNSYLKVSDIKAGANPFNMIPGMKIQTLDKMTLRGETTHQGITLNECRSTCLDSNKCKAISYSKVAQTCIISTATIEYDQGTDYFEKQAPRPYDPAPFDKRVATERTVKMESQLELLGNLIKQRNKAEEISIKKLAYYHQLPQPVAAERDSKASQMEYRPVKMRVPFAPNL